MAVASPPEFAGRLASRPRLTVYAWRSDPRQQPLNHTSAAVAGAATFAWLGMILAISLLETPLKFRAPGVTVPVGVGIGRVAFQALNLAERALAGVVVVAGVVGG